jgi:hypothetical protein
MLLAAIQGLILPPGVFMSVRHALLALLSEGPKYGLQLMQEWTRLKEDDKGRDIAFSLVVDSELFRIDSVVRWLDAAEARLRRALADGWNPAQAAAATASAGLPVRPKMGARR